MSQALWGFAESEGPARRLAALLAIPFHNISVRRFPDGESLVRADESKAQTAILYRSLDDPNAKLVELILAASALRDGGARRVVLVVPYLAYMRQDIAFHPGEAVSQRVIGQLIASHFDALVTVDPHLHRTARLDDVMPSLPAIAVRAAPSLLAMLEQDLAPGTVLVGPDSESRQWVKLFADALHLDCIIGEKDRRGDRAVDLAFPGIEQVAGRPVLLIDDLISSGGTLLACAALLQEAGAASIEAVASHCLASAGDLARLAAGGIARVRATDTVPGPVAFAPIAPVLAEALRTSGLLKG